MAVHRMQNLQLLSNTGQKRGEYGPARLHAYRHTDYVLSAPRSIRFVKASCARSGLSSSSSSSSHPWYKRAGMALHTGLLFPFFRRTRCYSAIRVIGAFTWNAATRRFQECQKVRCLHCLVPLFFSPPLSAVISKPRFFFFFPHRQGLYGAVTQHTQRAAVAY